MLKICQVRNEHDWSPVSEYEVDTFVRSEQSDNIKIFLILYVMQHGKRLLHVFDFLYVVYNFYQ